LKEVTNNAKEGNKQHAKQNEIHKDLLPLARKKIASSGLIGEYAERGQ
jgi:hypothetical protein